MPLNFNRALTELGLEAPCNISSGNYLVIAFFVVLYDLTMYGSLATQFCFGSVVRYFFNPPLQSPTNFSVKPFFQRE